MQSNTSHLFFFFFFSLCYSVSTCGRFYDKNNILCLEHSMFRLNLITPKHLRIGLTQIFNHIIQDVTISSSP